MNATSAKAIWCGLVAASVLLLGVREGTAQEPLTLEVNRANGTIKMLGTADINGYSIISEGGFLDSADGVWNSLKDQGVEGFVEANPRPEMLSELNPTGRITVNGEATIGAPYTGITLAPLDEAISWQYSDNCATCGAGNVLDGAVEFVGAINDLVLRVDAASGAGAIELASANVGPFDVTGYSIFSDSEALLVDFTGLGGGFTKANPQPGALADLNLTESQMFTTGTSLPIGNILAAGSEVRDLSFEFSTVAGDLLTGTVDFGPTNGGGADCNMDGVVDINDANCTPDALLDGFLAGLTPASLRGDADGDGMVQFEDLVILSNNFGLPGQYTDADFDKDGTVQFGDLVILSDRFGQSGGAVAAAVPEPSTGLLALLGFVGLAAVRRMRPRLGHVLAACLGLVLVVGTMDSAQARDLDTRMILLDAANPGANAQINTALEAQGILNGTVTDVNIATDVTGTVDFVDFAGGGGVFDFDNPYPDGTNDASLDDFTVRVTGALQIPEGEWLIGLNSDDGGYISLPRVTFTETGGENGARGVSSELMYNGTRGASTTAVPTWGKFTVPAGGLRTEIDTLMFERGGGDSYEIAVLNPPFTPGAEADELAQFGELLGDTTFGWEVIDGPGPGDFNWDDAVDFADFAILADNFGTGSNFAQGDINADGVVDLVDFTELVPLLSAPGGGAAAVPEPSSLALLGLGALALMRFRRRR